MSENEEKDPATWEQGLTDLGTKASEQLDSLAEKSKGWGEDLLRAFSRWVTTSHPRRKNSWTRKTPTRTERSGSGSPSEPVDEVGPTGLEPMTSSV